MAPAEPTHYDVLGVDPDATAGDIRRAYLRLARDHHPDFHTNAPAALRAANEREMQRINEAWAVLGDAGRRERYDLQRRSDDRPDPRRGHGPGPADYRFVPFDDGPDVDHVELLDDTPVAGTSVSRSWQVVPAVLFVVGGLATLVGVVVLFTPLVAVGVILGLLGLLGFVATPVLAIARSLQAEREP